MNTNQIPQPALDYYKEHVADELKLMRPTGDIRPWGGYLHITKQSHFDEKILWINPVSQVLDDLNALSLQYHGLKESPGHFETWLALTDTLLLRSTKPLFDDHLQVDDHFGLLHKHIHNHLELIYIPAGEIISINSRTLHALINPFEDHLSIVKERRESLDKSSKDTSEDTREQDIFRILDNSGRDDSYAYSHPDYNWVKDEIFSFVKTIKPHTQDKKRIIKIKIKKT